VTVLITGGTGVLGTVVARQASLAGHSLRLLVRNDPDARSSIHERVLGDLGTGEGLQEAVAGVDAIPYRFTGASDRQS
jgi:nucleoside-diphosphate-sugar epimerase